VCAREDDKSNEGKFEDVRVDHAIVSLYWGMDAGRVREFHSQGAVSRCFTRGYRGGGKAPAHSDQHGFAGQDVGLLDR